MRVVRPRNSTGHSTHTRTGVRVLVCMSAYGNVSCVLCAYVGGSPPKKERQKARMRSFCSVLRVAVCGCSECIQPFERILYSEQPRCPKCRTTLRWRPHTPTHRGVLCVSACLRVLSVCSRVYVCVCWCAFKCIQSRATWLL